MFESVLIKGMFSGIDSGREISMEVFIGLSSGDRREDKISPFPPCVLPTSF
jgi:hypothetical protein